MMVVKAPVLQKAALTGALRPVLRHFRAEPAHAYRAGDGVEVRGGFQRRGDDGLAEAVGGELLADASRPVAALGVLADELRGVARIVQEALLGELVEERQDEVVGKALLAEPRVQLRGREVAAAEVLQRREARGGRITRDRLVDRAAPPAAEAPPSQLSLSLSAAAASGLRGGSSFSRTCCSMSRAISGCSRRKLRVLSLPWPMRSPL